VDTWLGITVLATPDTGLDDPATFFYGSVAGETGAAFTGKGQFFGRDAADMQAVAANLFRRRRVDSPTDLNRDGRVDAFDLQLIPVASGGGFASNVLAAITPQTGPLPLAGATVDEAVAEEDPIENIAVLPPNSGSFAGYEATTDERLGVEDSTDLDLAFAAFAVTETDEPVPSGLISALTPGKQAL
jgi:hypothetical protein